MVDDEAMALKYFTRAFGDHFPVYSARSAQEALEILEARSADIGVIVTDQRMPEFSGVELLKVVRDRFPETVRILTTAYSDLEVLVEAINAGAVYSFVSKPWELEKLDRTLLDALDEHERQYSDARFVGERIDELKAKLLEDRVYDIGLISAKIGHYVHNALCPLTFLIDELLQREGTKESYSLEFLQDVRKHVFDVAHTLKDLEQVSVPPNFSELEKVNLRTVIEKALEETSFMRQQKRLQIVSHIETELPMIHGVANQIEKLFRFMIAEEIVSLPADSRVVLRVFPSVGDGELLGVNVEFEDFEPIAEKLREETLLYPFNLRGKNPREFGIFLVSCYFIVRHHGGTLNARVKDDQGLIFSYFLPLEPRGEDLPAGMIGDLPGRYSGRNRGDT